MQHAIELYNILIYQLPDVLIAQLVEHCTGIAKIMGSRESLDLLQVDLVIASTVAKQEKKLKGL